MSNIIKVRAYYWATHDWNLTVNSESLQPEETDERFSSDGPLPWNQNRSRKNSKFQKLVPSDATVSYLLPEMIDLVLKLEIKSFKLLNIDFNCQKSLSAHHISATTYLTYFNIFFGHFLT